MMDYRKKADEFYASLGMDRPKVSPGEKANIVMVAARVLAFLQGNGRGPYTLLLPDGDKLDDLEIETEEMDQGVLDGFVGWFIDLVLIGNDLSTGIDQALAKSGGKLILSTVGGSSVTVTRDNGQIVVIDPWGVRGVVSDALVKGPVVTTHSVDNLIMWDGWKDYLLPPRD
jgi:hypothetical protein